MRNRKTAIAALLIAMIVMVWLAFRGSPAMPSQSLAFAYAPLPSTNAGYHYYSISVSNQSDRTLLIAYNFTNIWLEAEYLSNGVWSEWPFFTPRVSGGHVLMRPHQVERATVRAPAGTTSFRVGVNYTSLTWKGRLHWFNQFRLPELLHPATRSMFQREIDKRSKTEWSENYPVKY